jgi:ADP-ribosylglycohydrolase
VTADRQRRALAALDGLSVGDALGERFFGPRARERVARREPPPGPWRWTDDTAMACALVEVLVRFGEVRQDELARAFGAAYEREPGRGYGPGMHRLLPHLGRGVDWRAAARALYRGQGSLGNGAAMRVAPLGAWFADDLERAVVEAARSAELTHAHPEGIAGAVAVAAAAALAATTARRGPDLIEGVVGLVPEGAVREGLLRARDLGSASPEEAARLLGSGALASAPDTVPFALWCASRSPDDYEAALWLTLRGLGDRDTTGAIVGGIVAARVGSEGIPPGWLAAREPLPPLPG